MDALGVWQKSGKSTRKQKYHETNANFQKSAKGVEKVENEKISTNVASFSSGRNSELIIKWPKIDPGNPENVGRRRFPWRGGAGRRVARLHIFKECYIDSQLFEKMT